MCFSWHMPFIFYEGLLYIYSILFDTILLSLKWFAYLSLQYDQPNSSSEDENRRSLVINDGRHMSRTRSTSTPSISDTLPSGSATHEQQMRVFLPEPMHKPLHKTLSDQENLTELAGEPVASEPKPSWARRLSVKVGLTPARSKTSSKSFSAIPGSMQSAGFFFDQQNHSKSSRLKVGKGRSTTIFKHFYWPMIFSFQLPKSPTRTLVIGEIVAGAPVRACDLLFNV